MWTVGLKYGGKKPDDRIRELKRGRKAFMPSPRTVLLSLVCFLTVGCGSSRQISLDIQPDQAEYYARGNHIVGSMKDNSVIAMYSFSERVWINSTARFNILLKNIGEEPTVFSIDNITAEVLNDAGEEPLHVRIYSYDELVKKAERSAAIGAVFAGLEYWGNITQASKAGYSHTEGSFSGPEGYGTYTQTTYDPAAEQAARAAADDELKSDLAEIEHDKQERISSLSSILRKSTVFPGMILSGEIRVAKPEKVGESASLIFLIDAAGDTHMVVFLLDEVAGR
ncbi:hypothetical protein [Prosthecochloris sp.]|uniref:hypothetical protein n=1 Tax=Prosthecochloris sp. TaxID=290513 RepID=UPI0025F0D5E0|nr:hypothetical protein [Prosthecochloris sp.]